MFISTAAVLHSPSAHRRMQLGEIPAQNALHPDTQNISMKVREVMLKHKKSNLSDELYLIGLVIDNISAHPFHISIHEFHSVKDNSRLVLDVPGIGIYHNNNGLIPGYLSFRILLMQSAEPARDFGRLLQRIIKSEELALLEEDIHNISRLSLANLKIFSQVAEKILAVMSRILKAQKDEQLLHIMGSYDNAFDGLGSLHGLAELGNNEAEIKFDVEVS